MEIRDDQDCSTLCYPVWMCACFSQPTSIHGVLLTSLESKHWSCQVLTLSNSSFWGVDVRHLLWLTTSCCSRRLLWSALWSLVQQPVGLGDMWQLFLQDVLPVLQFQRWVGLPYYYYYSLVVESTLWTALWRTANYSFGLCFSGISLQPRGQSSVH